MASPTMTKIYVKGNFLIYTNESNLFFADNVENVLLSKSTTTSTSYFLYLKGINKLVNDIPFADIVDESNTPYVSQVYFENYIYTYTGNRVSLPLVSIGELDDVAISAPSNGQVLEYNSTTGKWENVSPSALGGDMTKAVYDFDNDGVVDSSEKLEFIGKNSTGTTIAKTKVVYISGATGQKPNITLADASLEATSSKTIGITRTSIANNADGYIITHGKIHDVDTSLFTDGDMLWLSETAGEFTNVIPSEPAHAVFIGYVAYAHPTAGKIILHIQNGYELNELHGVLISSESNNDVLTYETSSGLWKNKQVIAEPPITSGTASQYWRGDKSWQTLDKTAVGLSNVPNLDTSNPANISQSATYRFVTDTEKSTWNSKENAITSGTTSQYFRGDKTFQTLDSNAVGLGNVPNIDATNPANIVQTSSYRFVTDAEKATWNATDFIPLMKGNETFRGVNYANNSTTETTSGGVTMATTASTIARSVSSTSYATKQVRKGFYGSTVTTGRYTGTRGSALLWYVGGGFKYVCDFFISDSAYSSNCQQFYGLQGSTADLNYGGTSLIALSTLTNIIGVGSEATDTNLQIIHNDATGTTTKIDLGINFPANRTSGAEMTTFYSVEIYNAPNTSTVNYRITNKETGNIAQGTLTTDLPDSTQGLNFFASRTMGSPITNTGRFDLSILGVYSL